MSEYVEDSSNTIFQVFNEFAEFLNCIYFFHMSDNKHIKNMALNSMRSHVRAISDFFLKTNDGKYKDDLRYVDILNTTDDLSISVSVDIRTFINKSTAHISKKRGTLSFDNKEYYDLVKQMILTIRDFMDRCETSLKTEYQSDFQSEDVKIQKDFINKRLAQVDECLINA